MYYTRKILPSLVPCKAIEMVSPFLLWKVLEVVELTGAGATMGTLAPTPEAFSPSGSCFSLISSIKQSSTTSGHKCKIIT